MYLAIYFRTFEGTVYVYSADVLPYNVLYSTCTTLYCTAVHVCVQYCGSPTKFVIEKNKNNADWLSCL